jgi:hypothetical protein
MKLNVVPPRTGLLWVQLGIKTFWRQPLALTGLFFMFWTVFLLLSLVPFIGLVAALVLTPVGTLGLLVATSQAVEGRFPWPGALIEGLRSGARKRRQLLLLGAANAVLVAAVILGVTALASQEPIGGAAAKDQAQLFVLTPATVIASLLQLPLTLLFTLAPALTFWHDVPAAKALFFSAVAVWRNLGAFCVFGLAWVGVLTSVLFLIGLLLRLVGAGIGVTLVSPIALMLLAMVSTSLFFTFRDSFSADPPSPTDDGEPR